MKILLTGATGFIGSPLRHALEARGHELVLVGRPVFETATGSRAAWVPLRFSAESSESEWLPHLAGVDAVVNAVGIFREQPGKSFEAVHVRGPIALFEACAAAGVRRVVQLSALGADAQASSAYHLSKRTADEALLALSGVEGVVVQPSLVFGTDGPSARFFLTLATLPVLVLPAGGLQAVQPVHLDDVVQALVALIEAPGHRLTARRLALVGPRALTLAGYLQGLRQTLHMRPARTFALPARWMGLLARLGDRLPQSLFDTASWGMLQRGNVADPSAMRQLLGREPREVSAFVAPAFAAPLRLAAQMAWQRWVLRASLAAVWIVTGIVSLGLYPVASSYELLSRAGVPAPLQPAALYGAAALDLALGVLTLLQRRHLQWLWRAQIALILAYTAIITLRLPEFWLHPYGPLLKNLPILAILWLLHTLEPRKEPGRWTT